MDYVVETNSLSKTFGQVLAVDSVDLRVRRGEIYGFVGLNGAGKSTTIRALLGMIRPSAGTVKVLGETIGSNGRDLWRRVGHMVEKPAAYPELTVRENLEVARRLQGIPDKKATTRIIGLMGLDTYADRKAAILSTGNLQRLGLARALLHEPELIILDEPANGLDPAGVVEIRDLLSNLAHQKGVTIFMSSHILTEVDRLATRIGFIHSGRLLEELDAKQLEVLRSRRLVVKARNLDAARESLVRAGFEVTVRDDVIILTDPRALDAPDDVATILVNGGAPPTRLVREQEDLESHFLRLTGGMG